MKSDDNEIKTWCERKYQDVVGILGTDNVDIHVYAYGGGDEWVVCDFFANDDKNKSADTTIAFGDDTNFDDLYSPHVKDVVTLFMLLEVLTKNFNGNIQFGMPEPEDK